MIESNRKGKYRQIQTVGGKGKAFAMGGRGDFILFLKVMLDKQKNKGRDGKKNKLKGKLNCHLKKVC